MAEIDVAVSLISMIALFLPAWAIMMQILIRVISNERIAARPRGIPFVAGAFATAIISLFLFGYSSMHLLTFFIESGAIGTSVSLAKATEFIMLGGLAFLFLGLFVLAEAGMDVYDESDFFHIITVTILFCFAAMIAYGGSRWESVPMSERPFRLFIGLTVVWAADLVYIQLTDPRVGDGDGPAKGVSESD